MSDGSLNYAYIQIREVADKLYGQSKPSWRAFAKHLYLVADALQDIERVLSYDYPVGAEDAAVSKVIDQKQELLSIIEDASALLDRADELKNLLIPNLPENPEPFE